MAIRYADYRAYDERRKEVNDAIMALLVGAKLAAHSLSLSEGSDRLLPEIFPQVEHVSRFNFRPDAARPVLDDAEEHLCAMAVPYLLAIHEDYVVGALWLLAQAGKITSQNVGQAKSGNMHAKVTQATGQQLPSDWLDVFHGIRKLRNCLVHAGGVASQSVVNYMKGLALPAQQRWSAVTNAPVPAPRVGERIVFRQAELVATLATTKALARLVNQQLEQHLPRARWAEMVVDEYLATIHQPYHDARKVGRKLRGIARHYYTSLSLTGPELEAAATSRGLPAQTQ